ncbi:hypothetical protein [Mucilaginibacter myungsuensis]|uniref:Uncharacterized protein n=1 Tax=Mucilaginibacter myungsuensis TaxID=649104 RepID=A0A929PV48_9SPHI|nr:hypothetical protein [Mucilaginibacter myungsuensis]MBE9660621.1 hypothetical protein [Mucilaginibacter myungsuensis]MDN3600666.1 hypothetical protein [Mucilaginibacter myungsuensis]
MKTLRITLASLVALVAIFSYNAASAQVRLSANINVGHPGAHRTVVVHRPPVVHRTVVVHRPAYRPAPRHVVVHRPAYRPAPRRVVVHRAHPRKVVMVHAAPRHVIYRHR